MSSHKFFFVMNILYSVNYISLYKAIIIANIIAIERSEVY